MNQHYTPVTVNSKKKNKTLKIFMILIWAIFLSINTWTKDLESLLDFQYIGFIWDPSPNFWSFFYFNDITLIHPAFILVKMGHFIGFAVMDLLIFNLIRNHKVSIGISVTYAFLTEFLQLFWGRDGRLYDLLIDTLGVLTVYFLIKTLKRQKN
jgi:hypothetical protein